MNTYTRVCAIGVLLISAVMPPVFGQPGSGTADPFSPEVPIPYGAGDIVTFDRDCGGIMVWSEAALGLGGLPAPNVDAISDLRNVFPPVGPASGGFAPGGRLIVGAFSVDRTSVGLSPGVVAAQSAGNGAASDTFRVPFSPPGPVTLNTNAWCVTPKLGETDIDGITLSVRTTYPVFYSVDPATAAGMMLPLFGGPPDVTVPVSPAHVIVVESPGATPAIYLTAEVLGLDFADDIDALAVSLEGGFVFSLTSTSPSLLTAPLGALMGGAGLWVWTPPVGNAPWAFPAQMDLLVTDELNAVLIGDPQELHCEDFDPRGGAMCRADGTLGPISDPNEATQETSFFRVFDVSNYGDVPELQVRDDDFLVIRVDTGLNFDGPAPEDLEVTVNLYSSRSDNPRAPRRFIDSSNVTYPRGTLPGTLLPHRFDEVNVGSEFLWVEVYVPAAPRAVLGAASTGCQIGPTYALAPGCNVHELEEIPEPLMITLYGYPKTRALPDPWLPEPYDANGDGIPDRHQEHVAGIPLPEQGAYLTCSTGRAGDRLQVAAAQTAGLPSHVKLPFGAIDLTAELDVRDDDSARTLGIWYTRIADSGIDPPTPAPGVRSAADPLALINTYWKYGPTPDNPSPHWYEFVSDGSTGAEFNGETVTIEFEDGGRGDDDLKANGELRDPGGPAISPPFSFYLPYYREEPGNFSGFAVSNYSPHPARLSYNAYSREGTPLQLPRNPAEFDLKSGRQLGLLGDQIFGHSGPGGLVGWIELTSDNPELGAFFQFGASNLSRLDGSTALRYQSRKIVVQRVYEGDAAFRGQAATTRLSLINPNPHPVSLTLRLHPLNPDGGAAPQGILEQQRSLPPKGALFESVAEIFGVGVSVSGGFVVVEVSEGRGVTGFEVIELVGKDTVIGLNAGQENGRTQFFSAQFAVGGDALFTNLNLINTSEETRKLTLTAIQADGTRLGEAVELTLGSGEQFSRDARDILFGDSDAKANGNEAFEASLILEADGRGVIGDVLFGDPSGFEFAAALPLQSQRFTEAVFNHVANVPGFFTGMAFFNPASRPTQLVIEVLSADGELVGETEMTLEPGERLSKLLPELVPESAGQAGGFVFLRSTRPLVAQLLFGAVGPEGITLFSAVPATVVL